MRKHFCNNTEEKCRKFKSLKTEKDLWRKYKSNNNQKPAGCIRFITCVGLILNYQDDDNRFLCNAFLLIIHLKRNIQTSEGFD